MYYYLYDTYLNSQRYNKVLTKVENRLGDLGISGRIGKLSILKDINELVKHEYELGVRNFIAVGNDQTLIKVINAVANYEVTVGYIPVSNDNYLANIFGILPEDLACDILSTRIIRKIDLGKINKHYFLFNAKIQSEGYALLCDKTYRISPSSQNCIVDIINLTYKVMPKGFSEVISCSDGYLNIVVSKPAKAFPNFSKIFKKSDNSLSFFKVKDITVETTNDIKVLVDGYKTFKMPIHITIYPKKLELIVGRSRKILI